MTKLYYGCDEVVRGWTRYFALCNALELDLSQEKNAPTIQTLNRWRVESPRNFCFMLHLDAEIPAMLAKASDRGSKRLPKDALHEAWARTQDRAKALAAKALVLSTSMEVTPGETSRALLEQIAALAAQDKRPLIWEPSGLWERASTREWASEAGLVMAYDPFLAMKDGEVCEGGDACFVLSERAGMRRKFDQYDLEELLDWMEPAQRAFVMLRGRFKEQHARELQYLVSELEGEEG